MSFKIFQESYSSCLLRCFLAKPHTFQPHAGAALLAYVLNDQLGWGALVLLSWHMLTYNNIIIHNTTIGQKCEYIYIYEHMILNQPRIKLNLWHSQMLIVFLFFLENLPPCFDLNAWCNHLFLSVKLMECLASLRLRHPRWSSFSFASHLPSPRYGNFGFSSRLRLQIVQIVDIYDICAHMAVLWTAVDAVIYAGNRSARQLWSKLFVKQTTSNNDLVKIRHGRTWKRFLANPASVLRPSHLGMWLSLAGYLPKIWRDCYQLCWAGQAAAWHSQGPKPYLQIAGRVRFSTAHFTLRKIRLQFAASATCATAFFSCKHHGIMTSHPQILDGC